MDLVTKQREERKERILTVARSLIAQSGYEGVTMRELADESLVSVPTLYNLFGGKNELLFAAVESFFLELFDQIRHASDEKGVARLVAIATRVCDHALDHAEYARSLMGFFGGASESGELREFVAGQLGRVVIDVLVEMQAHRQLVAWVDVNALGERLASLMIITSFEWSNGRLEAEGLKAAVLFGAAAILLGFARGKTVGELEKVVREQQTMARVRSVAG